MKKSLLKFVPIALGALALTTLLTDSKSTDVVGQATAIEVSESELKEKLAESKDIIVMNKSGLYPGPDLMRSMLFTRQTTKPSPAPKFIDEVIENEDLSKFDQ